MKKFVKMLIIGLIIGIVLTIIQVVTDVDRDVFMNLFLKAGIIFLIAVIVINTAYFAYYSNKLEKIMPLFAEKNYSEYNKQMEELLKKTKVRFIKETIRINLSAGYLENKEFEKALKILEEVKIEEMKGSPLTFVYWNNLCDVYFRTGNFKKFIEVYDANKKLFDKHRNDKNFEANVFQLDIIRLSLDGKYDSARESVAEKNLENPEDYEKLIQTVENWKLSKKK